MMLPSESELQTLKDTYSNNLYCISIKLKKIADGIDHQEKKRAYLRSAVSRAFYCSMHKCAEFISDISSGIYDYRRDFDRTNHAIAGWVYDFPTTNDVQFKKLVKEFKKAYKFLKNKRNLYEYSENIINEENVMLVFQRLKHIFNLFDSPTINQHKTRILEKTKSHHEHFLHSIHNQ